MRLRDASLTFFGLALAGCGSDDTNTPPDPTDASDVAVMDAAVDNGGSADAGVDAGPVDVYIPPTPITLRTVSWQSTMTDLGAISALTESDNTLFLFGARGLQVLSGGVVTAMDARVMTWREAGVIPAGDGSMGTWVVGLDEMGRVWRVRDRMTLEDVTGRYGLTMRPARSVATLSGNRTVFGLQTGFAVANGMTVTVWNDPSFTNLVASGNRVAARTMAGVRVFNTMTTTNVDFTIAGVTGVAFNAQGRLVVAVGNALYTENMAGELVLQEMAPAAIRAVEQSGARTWLIVGNNLGVWDGQDIRIATAPSIAAGAKLVGSASGDVWVIAGGMLNRYGFEIPPDVQRWEETVRPIFARRCTPCHLPGGTGNVDFTTYAAWAMRRADIRGRVFTTRDMPPPPGMLTDAERMALQAWLDGAPGDGGVMDGGRADAVVTDRPVTDTGPVDRPVVMDVPRDAGTMMDVPRDTVTVMDVPRDMGTVTDRPADVPRDTGPRDTGPRDAGPVTYIADIDPIFQSACVRCHGTSGGLNLSNPMTAYTALVNAPAAGASCMGGGRIRVVPNNPMTSLLYLKLVNMQNCGNSMPRGGTLAASDIELVRVWIATGAVR